MRYYRRWIIIIAIVVTGITIGSATDIYRSITANLRQFNNVVNYLLSEYVDEIDSEKLVHDGIRGMLEDLDPYTVYIKEEDQSSVNMLNECLLSQETLLFQLIEILSVPLSHTPLDKALILSHGHFLVL